MSQSISLFRGLSSFLSNEKRINQLSERLVPSLKLQADKEVYRPGDFVNVTINIVNPGLINEGPRLLVDKLTFEIKGIEKLDVQWFAKQLSLPGSRQKRGEHTFLDCKTPFIISQLVLSPGCSKTIFVRVEMPSAVPPSYRGTTVRYLYYVRSTVVGHWLENPLSKTVCTKEFSELEVCVPLQIWITQRTNRLLTEGQIDGSFSFTTFQVGVSWKEEGDSEWVTASEEDAAIEDGCDSSRDEISSVSSYNISKGNLDQAFGSSLSLTSHAPKPSNKDTSLLSDMVVSDRKLNFVSSEHSIDQESNVPSDSNIRDNELSHTMGAVDLPSSEGFIRGKSYNIRMDDQVLLRFSPKNSDSTYYFNDMIGGTLTFFHAEGTRRCLEVSVTLEISETIDRSYLHHSRKNSPAINRIQSDYHEVVADIVQTSFLFSIPVDGPMSFSTPRVSVQWALRFEFLTTPKNVDWSRYEHPLLVERREKGEWILPITVHAPPPRAQTAHSRNEKPLAIGDLWVRS